MTLVYAWALSFDEHTYVTFMSFTEKSKSVMRWILGLCWSGNSFFLPFFFSSLHHSVDTSIFPLLIYLILFNMIIGRGVLFLFFSSLPLFITVCLLSLFHSLMLFSFFHQFFLLSFLCCTACKQSLLPHLFYFYSASPQLSPITSAQLSLCMNHLDIILQIISALDIWLFFFYKLK